MDNKAARTANRAHQRRTPGWSRATAADLDQEAVAAAEWAIAATSPNGASRPLYDTRVERDAIVHLIRQASLGRDLPGRTERIAWIQNGETFEDRRARHLAQFA